MIFLDKNFFWKNLIDFWHPKLTLKVRFWHFLTNCHYSWDYFKDFSLVACWFLAKNLAFKDPPSLKFHDRTDINVTSQKEFQGYQNWVNHRAKNTHARPKKKQKGVELSNSQNWGFARLELIAKHIFLKSKNFF